ncbi:MAG: EutN/CcmL family microcompartment protein [Bacteroidales bacterium]|nr:EutN/CcmL family microcompartment protein [Bacteroidales bacterium]
MILGKVVGTVVSSKQNVNIEGAKFLLIEQCNQKGEKRGNFIIVLDLVGAGNNELVMVSQSTPARETSVTANKPVDAIIVGIIDVIDENGKVVYTK